jgi:integrase
LVFHAVSNPDSWEIVGKNRRGEMARSIKSPKIDSRTARRAIAKDNRDHWTTISRGRALGYRKGLKGGTWSARFRAGTFRREEKLGDADDDQNADGIQILDFAQAIEAAQKFYRDALKESTGESPRGGSYTVADAVRDYLKSLENRSAPDYRGAVYDFNRNTLPPLGAIEVGRITRGKIESWRASLAARPRLSQKKKKKDRPSEAPRSMNEDEKRRRRSTTNRSVRRLVAALNFAIANRKTDANPANWKITPFENSEVSRTDYLTESQQRDFVTACGEEVDFQNFVLAGLQTGCRLGELARLRIRDFDRAQKTIHVEQSKSGSSRYVFLDADAVEFFERLVRNRTDNDLLFARKAGDKDAVKLRAWDKDAVKLPMRRACKRASIHRLGFHQLRHSFATRLLTRGVPMKIVAQQMGHTSVRMLEKYYGHIVDAHAQQVIAELPSAGLNRAATVKRGNVVALPSRGRSA